LLYENRIERQRCMRLLTEYELNLVAGGRGSSDIVVTAPTWVDWSWTFSDDGGPRGGGSSGGSEPDPEPEYPDDFDKCADKAADKLAEQIKNEMKAKDNIKRVEYGAIIWRDSEGDVHRTGVIEGTRHNVELDKSWSEVDFAKGGKVIGIMHSHPSEYPQSSFGGKEQWVPSTNGHDLSTGDFDNLIAQSSGSAPGFDPANMRYYLYKDGEVKEYYGFQQDAAQVKREPALGAFWAVESNDYKGNINSPRC